ncbi:unnamed protein product, partial [Ectocarpus fasciculatus]
QQHKKKKRQLQRASAAAAASAGTAPKKGGSSVDLTGDGDDGWDGDASPSRGDDSDYAGETGGRKVGKRKKRSRGRDGGQSGDEASVPEEQSEKPLAERSRVRSLERSEGRPSPAAKDNLGIGERGNGKDSAVRRGEGGGGKERG